METSTDHGTVLPPEAWAATWSEAEGYTLLTPDLEPDAIVHPDALALMAALLRLDRDEEFRAGLSEWMARQSNLIQ